MASTWSSRLSAKICFASSALEFEPLAAGHFWLRKIELKKARTTNRAACGKNFIGGEKYPNKKFNQQTMPSMLAGFFPDGVFATGGRSFSSGRDQPLIFQR